MTDDKDKIVDDAAAPATEDAKSMMTQDTLRRAWQNGLRFVVQADGLVFKLARFKNSMDGETPQIAYSLREFRKGAEVGPPVTEVDATALWAGTLEQAEEFEWITRTPEGQHHHSNDGPALPPAAVDDSDVPGIKLFPPPQTSLRSERIAVASRIFAALVANVEGDSDTHMATAFDLADAFLVRADETDK